jgi:CRISPR/Cas system CMR subunit Cmr4 (Cas7 group RAMP superfamily)
MRLEAGEQLLRLEVLSPAHLGAAEGEAALDRPTQKESRFGLPYLPDSALKGVLAGVYGNVPAKGENVLRERLFGSPDRRGRNGRPGPLVFGNGELLCFPFPGPEGRPAWVFPALSVARFLRYAGGGEELAPALAVLRWVEGSREGRQAFSWPALPALAVAAELVPLTGGSVQRNGPALVAQLRRLAGPSLPAEATLVVAASERAGFLWRFAAERRVLTALDSGARVVAAGSLRAVELIPPGAIFLSLVSCLEGPEEGAIRDPLLQLGAWEGLGFGWLRPSVLESGPLAVPAPGPAAADRSLRSQPDEGRILMAMHRAIRRLDDGEEPANFKAAVKSAIDSFGSRAQRAGLLAALAFELAKARPAHSEPKLEARAHRWLLRALLLSADDPEPLAGPSEPLLGWLKESPFAPGQVEERRDLLFARWRWLRRFAELGLGGGEGAAA